MSDESAQQSAAKYIRIILGDHGPAHGIDTLREIALSYIVHLITTEGRGAFDHLMQQRANAALVHRSHEKNIKLVWSRPNYMGAV